MVAADRKKRKTALENQYLREYDDFKGINAEQKEVFKWIFLKQLIREAAIAAKDKAAAEEALKAAIGQINRAATKGVYHKNTAARKVSRLTLAVNKMA